MHSCYTGEFVTDVKTSCPQLWENNPFLTPVDELDLRVEVIDCHYPLIHRSNDWPYHFIHGFIYFLNERLGLNIQPTCFKGDIHLSESETAAAPPTQEIFGDERPYWIVCAGGKRDFTIKWWDPRRYQEVVDHLRGRLQFVQVGGAGHFHPELEGVVDLRGKTDLRQLIRLMYHADGVLTPVSLLMHLAAAVPTKAEARSPKWETQACSSRPCVVIAGGREPPHWEAYPTHQFIHTVGMLPCCKTGGCWRSRTLPLRDKSEHNQPKHLCVDVVGNLPRCMDMITSAEVIRRIEMYLVAGKIPQPAVDERDGCEIITPTERLEFRREDQLTVGTARARAEEFIATVPEYPGAAVNHDGTGQQGRDFEGAAAGQRSEQIVMDRFLRVAAPFKGRGIVICGGGVRYFGCAWVCINMLRRFGCKLPIQLWHLGEREMDEAMDALVAPLGVECVDAAKVRQRNRARILNGWELKPFSILHSPFTAIP